MTSRSTIRHAFASLLTGLATTGARVYTSRTRPLTDAELPCILVFSGEAEVDEEEYGVPVPVTFTYELRADILVKSTTASEDTADQILSEVLSAVFASEHANTLAGAVDTVSLIKVGEPDLDDGLEKPVIRLPLLFRTRYLQ